MVIGSKLLVIIYVLVMNCLNLRWVVALTNDPETIGDIHRSGHLLFSPRWRPESEVVLGGKLSLLPFLHGDVKF